MVTISAEAAKKFLLRYQNLNTPRQLKTDNEITAFIRKVGCIQYDPLNKIARNADLILQSRCSNYTPSVLHRLLYEKRLLIDGWDKNMAIWCVEDWPYFVRKREEFRIRYEARADEFGSLKNEILKMLKKRECVSSKDLDDDRKVEWSWAPTSIGRAVLESMYHAGELIIHHREGARKYYGLTVSLLPELIIKTEDPNRTYNEFAEWYVKRRIGGIGLLWSRAGDAWLGTDLTKKDRDDAVSRLVEKKEIEEISVDSKYELFYMRKEDTVFLQAKDTAEEASLIAPLDNLMWDRKLIRSIYGFDYKWEVYTPEKNRKYGYYVLPVVYGNDFIGRCEPIMDRKSRTIIMNNWWWEKKTKVTNDMKEALIRCFTNFIRFLDVDTISMSKYLDKKKFSWLKKCI